jgi:queuine tRNA-ribosyltransferase
MENSFKFKITAADKKTGARTGVFTTPHGKIQTPIFMPVGTLATVKSLSPHEIEDLGAQIILANTYHLYLRPGHELIKKMGGLHKWMNWKKPILTDSGGYQVFSLGAGKKHNKKDSFVKIRKEGVEFRSHLDGSKHFLTPEKVMEIETALGADIIMAFDECAPADSSHAYAKEAMERTHAWLLRCREKHLQLQKKSSNPRQALFPIIQGVIYDDLRIESAKFCAAADLPGIAIGGLSVGEKRETMYHILDVIHPYYPENKPRYLMGVGTPKDIFEGVERGIDMFDCVHATRLARHGNYYDQCGRQHITNSKYKADPTPLQKGCKCYSCRNFSKSYIRHLMMENEMLGARLLTIHNLHFLLDLMGIIRKKIANGTFSAFKKQYFKKFKSLV